MLLETFHDAEEPAEPEGTCARNHRSAKTGKRFATVTTAVKNVGRTVVEWDQDLGEEVADDRVAKIVRPVILVCSSDAFRVSETDSATL